LLIGLLVFVEISQEIKTFEFYLKAFSKISFHKDLFSKYFQTNPISILWF
jgi:hypothetical protein